MRAKINFLRYVLLITLFLTGFQSVPAEPAFNQPGAHPPRPAQVAVAAPPQGISPAAWDEILRQVGQDAALSAAPDPLRTNPVKKISGNAAGEGFGISTAVSGDTAVIGAYHTTVLGNLERGAAYIYARNQGGAAEHWGMVAMLTAFDGEAYDRFGISVAISGDMVVVGACYANVDGKADQGAAYVYRRNQGGANVWGLVKKLTASSGLAYDYFGVSVAVSGWLVAVGADSVDLPGQNNQGAAYLFARNQGGMDVWGQLPRLTASDGAAAHYFGGAVALANDTLVVGAWGADYLGMLGQGVAYVFERNQGGSPDGWGMIKKLAANEGAAYDRFGYAVAINVQADTIVVGAYYTDVDGASNRGAAYVFTRNQGGSADGWGQAARLTAFDGAANDKFGNSVSVSHNRILVGAPGNESSRGAVYRFECNQGGLNQWGLVEKITAWDGSASDNLGLFVALNEVGDTAILGAAGDDSWRGAAYVFDWQGISWKMQREWAAIERLYRSSVTVAISGDTLAVGVWDETIGEEVCAGAVYIFYRNWGGPEDWGMAKKVTANDYAYGDDFGYSVALSGDTLVVGAPYADINYHYGAGAAYVYYRNRYGPEQWGLVQKITASDLNDGDYFGVSAAISGDTLVVGASWADVSGQAEAGAAYVFSRNQNGVDAWGEVAKIFADDYSAEDYFGDDVAINGDTLVVGAEGVDPSPGMLEGAAYVFSRNWGGENAWGQVQKLTSSDPDVYHYYGGSVAIDGDVLVVGSMGFVDELVNAGFVHVYSRNLGGADHWGYLKTLVASDPGFEAYFGSSVAISGDTLLVGAPGAAIDGEEHTGEAYIFSRNWGGMDNWGQVVILAASSPLDDRVFGYCVAIDGSTAVAGAMDAAYVFQESSAGVFLPVTLR